MLNTLKKQFGGNKTIITKLIKEGSVILGVRITSKFASGYVEGSINAPLNELNGYLKTFKKNNFIILFMLDA